MQCPSLNQWVQWYPYADRKQSPHLAWVTGVGRDTLTLCYLLPGDGAMRTKTVSGVRHIDDADLARNITWQRTQGGWDWLRNVEPTPPVTLPAAKRSQKDIQRDLQKDLVPT